MEESDKAKIKLKKSKDGDMTKRKARFSSLSTPGVKQDCSNYLVELAFLRANHGTKLTPRFWQQTKYKFRYRREIQACRKFIKKYGEPSVLYVAMHNHIITWTNYGNVEFLLQQRVEKFKRIAEAKDTSPVKSEDVISSIDLRENRIPVPKKMGLFEKLEEMSK